MPTQRAHGGAAIVPINLVAPAFAGLNTESEATILGQEWATVLKNAVFDSAGRVAVRKGWTTATTTPVAGIPLRLFEFFQADNTSEIIFSTDADIFSGTAAPSSVEGSLGITDGQIKFLNFNDKCVALGVGTSNNPAIYTGTGNFVTVTVATGTAPTGSVGTSAFGRLWVVDADGKTIRYCALLDETKWDVADGGGIIDMSKVWPAGQDTVTAIEELAGNLVVFGKNNIVIWADSAQSTVGIDPTNIWIADTMPGVGCVSQFAVARALGDLFFVSSSGLQSLKRALQDKNTPLNNVTKNVQSSYMALVDAESDPDDITLVYSPRDDFLLTVFPSSDKAIHMDTSRVMQDGTYRTTEWVTELQTAAYRLSTRALLGTITTTVGEVFTHTGLSDDGTNYDFSYESGWLDLGEEMAGFIKVVKRMTSFVFVQSDTTINFTLKYDFNTNPRTFGVAAEGAGVGAEYSIGEWSLGEYGGGITIRKLSVPGQGSGQYIKVGINLDTAAAQFALQQINLYAKIGRIA